MSFLVRMTCVAALLVGSLAAHANEGEGPVYQRGRSGGQSGYGYQSGKGHGSRQPSYSRRGRGHTQQNSSGNWFVRPYPYHFDYYKWRYSTPPVVQDCPCAEQEL